MTTALVAAGVVAALGALAYVWRRRSQRRAVKASQELADALVRTTEERAKVDAARAREDASERLDEAAKAVEKEVEDACNSNSLASYFRRLRKRRKS